LPLMAGMGPAAFRAMIWAEAAHPDPEGRHRAGRLIDGAMRIEGGYRPTGWGDDR
jgi:hypothetical protein